LPAATEAPPPQPDYVDIEPVTVSDLSFSYDSYGDIDYR